MDTLLINKIEAIVTSMQTSDILNITSFSFQNFSLAMMSLELENINVGDRVLLSVKPTAVAIAKEINGLLSYSNQLQGVIIFIDYGKLLTDIHVLVKDTTINAIITTNSAKRMNLKQDDEVTCLIKASDLSLYEKIL